MSETPENKKACLHYDNVFKTAWTDEFISVNIPEREINLHFVNSAGLIPSEKKFHFFMVLLYYI